MMVQFIQADLSLTQNLTLNTSCSESHPLTVPQNIRYTGAHFHPKPHSVAYHRRHYLWASSLVRSCSLPPRYQNHRALTAVVTPDARQGVKKLNIFSLIQSLNVLIAFSDSNLICLLEIQNPPCLQHQLLNFWQNIQDHQPG